MKLVVGLGNPGKEHCWNRHNAGFFIIDAWLAALNKHWEKKKPFGEIAKFTFQNEEVVALKPLTFMNRSGEAVQEVMNFFKIPIADVIVLHDEVDIPACTFRIKRSGGHGGHNGLRSIVPFGEDFTRIRLGIGRPLHQAMDTANYVLADFSAEEKQQWAKLLPKIFDALEMCLLGNVDKAMNFYNRKE